MSKYKDELRTKAMKLRIKYESIYSKFSAEKDLDKALALYHKVNEARIKLDQANSRLRNCNKPANGLNSIYLPNTLENAR